MEYRSEHETLKWIVNQSATDPLSGAARRCLDLILCYCHCYSIRHYVQLLRICLRVDKPSNDYGPSSGIVKVSNQLQQFVQTTNVHCTKYTIKLLIMIWYDICTVWFENTMKEKPN